MFNQGFICAYIIGICECMGLFGSMSELADRGLSSTMKGTRKPQPVNGAGLRESVKFIRDRLNIQLGNLPGALIKSMCYIFKKDGRCFRLFKLSR